MVLEKREFTPESGNVDTYAIILILGTMNHVYHIDLLLWCRLQIGDVVSNNI